MKKLLVLIIGLVCFSSVFADATLRMKIAGPINDNRYFLCVTGVGCVSIFNGNKGHTYPLQAGEVSRIYTVNASNMSFRLQGMPSSCNVTVKDNQTLTVSGRLVEGPNKMYSMSDLRCTVR